MRFLAAVFITSFFWLAAFSAFAELSAAFGSGGEAVAVVVVFPLTFALTIWMLNIARKHAIKTDVDSEPENDSLPTQKPQDKASIFVQNEDIVSEDNSSPAERIKKEVNARSSQLTYAMLFVFGFLIFIDVNEFFDDFELQVRGSIGMGFLDNFLDYDQRGVAFFLLVVIYAFLSWKYAPRIERWLLTR